MIQEELTGFREASIVVPTIALIVAALVGALACARVDDLRRRRRLLAITIAAAGVVGVAIGLAGAAIGGPELAESVYLPEHVGANNLGVALLGLAARRDRRRGRARASVGCCASATTTPSAPAPRSSPRSRPRPRSSASSHPGGVVDSAEATLDAAARLEQVSAQVAFATPVNDALLAQARSDRRHRGGRTGAVGERVRAPWQPSLLDVARGVPARHDAAALRGARRPTASSCRRRAR